MFNFGDISAWCLFFQCHASFRGCKSSHPTWGGGSAWIPWRVPAVEPANSAGLPWPKALEWKRFGAPKKSAPHVFFCWLQLESWFRCIKSKMPWLEGQQLEVREATSNFKLEKSILKLRRVWAQSAIVCIAELHMRIVSSFTPTSKWDFTTLDISVKCMTRTNASLACTWRAQRYVFRSGKLSSSCGFLFGKLLVRKYSDIHVNKKSSENRREPESAFWIAVVNLDEFRPIRLTLLDSKRPLQPQVAVVE